MTDIEQLPIEKLQKLYNKFFSLGYLNTDINKKFALISMICYLTYGIRQKGKTISCYDLILKLRPNADAHEKEGMYKSLAIICEDLMYGCKEFPTFGLQAKDMVAEITKILDTYVPF